MGPLGAADSTGQARRTAAQDRHALGNECDLLSSANRLLVALFAARGLPAALDGLQHLPRFPAGGSVGSDLGGAARGPARTAGAGGEPQRRGHRQPVAQVGRKRGCAKGEADAVGYDAGKKVKGRKIHALVDTEGLPLRVVVHSAAIQDRDGTALVFDRIRQRFNWLELVWADGGYNARQVERVAAAQPPLRVEIVKRPHHSSGCIVLPRRWVVERTFSVVRPKPTSGQGLRKPR
jgi:transposase